MRIVEALIKEIEPPNSKPGDVKVGLHWSAVRSNYTGLSHTFKTSGKAVITHGGKLTDITLMDLSKMALSYNSLDASVGMAAVNSLIQPRGQKGNVNSLFKRMARDKTVSIIGRFPINDEIRKIAKRCYILEMDPGKDEYPSYACDELLPKCDVNLITATTLINHTLDHLLELGGSGFNIILGPTTPFSDILFDRGADVLAGVKVVDHDQLVTTITQGVKKFKDIGGIQPIYLKRK